MANFCSYCGKPLADGEVCNCRAEAAQAPQAAPAAAPAAAGNAKAALNGFVPFFKEYFKSPLAVTRKAAQKTDLANSVIAMIIYALSYGLFVYALCTNIIGAIEDAAGSWFEIEITVPFFTILLFGILIAALALAVFALAVFCIAKLGKVNINIKQALVIVGVNAIFPAICTLAAIICLFISLELALILLALGTVFAVVLFVAVPLKVLDIDLSGKMTCFVVVAWALALVVNVWIGSKLNTSAIGKIEVEGEKIEDAIEEFQDEFADMELMDILNNFM